MFPNNEYPTPYPDANAVLARLLQDVKAILCDYFIGLYLYGSLALGDFNPNRSDIDFLVVTTRKLPKKIIPLLERMHSNIQNSGLKWAGKLEGAYLTKNTILRYKPDSKKLHPEFEGKFYFSQHQSNDIINLHVIREHGVALAGPHPKKLIKPISPSRLKQATRDILVRWWAPMITNQERMLSGPGYPAYCVHTMCRILYTLEYGAIVSKPHAVKWALDKLDERWLSLIEQASKWEDGQPSLDINETQQLIGYTLMLAKSV
jgi:hypothetical protein